MKLARGFWTDLSRVVPCPKRRAALKKLWGTHELIPGEFPKTAKWVRSCYHEPWFQDVFLSACDETLNNYGVEAVEIRAGKWFQYSNAGDPYVETVVFWRGKFVVASWGDIVESEEL